MKILLNSQTYFFESVTESCKSEPRRFDSRFFGWSALGLLLALMTFGNTPVRASDPVGIYALVDKVVFEPNANAPERIQIWGAFAIAENTGYSYKHAERGYLYYALDPAKSNLCRNEWSDLKAVAGTGQIVTFGSRYQEKGSLRKDDIKPGKPDKYPIAMGLAKVRKDQTYGPVKELLALWHPSAKSPENSAASKK